MVSSWPSLASVEQRELTELAEALSNEAASCAASGQWRAAILCLGAAVEAGIVATAVCTEAELRQQGLWPAKAKCDPRKWSLGEAIQFAKRADWLPSALPAKHEDLLAPLQGEIGDAVAFLISLRNMVVHPGAYVREAVRPDFTDVEHMHPTYDVLVGIAQKVFDQLTRALRDASETGSTL